MLTVVISAAGCGANQADTISVTSPDFSEGGQLPDRYTCYGVGVSPPLRWTGVPAAASALAIIVDDPDAPRGTYTHWVVFDLPPQVHELALAATPPQARQATNSAGTIGYSPPCPPSGTHHYQFTVVGLRDRIGLPNGAPLDGAIQRISAESLARGTLTATLPHR